MKTPVEFARDVLGIDLYPLQAEALMAMAGHRLVTLAPVPVVGAAAKAC